MNMLIAGFILGLGSSLHCIGMCGPLILAVPRSPNRNVGRMVYHGGRLLTYSLLGFLFGGIGQGLGFIAGQQGLSVIAGLTLFALYLGPVTGMKLPAGPLMLAGSFLRKKYRSLTGQGTYLSAFVPGLLNGLLPCGAVYMALAASAVSPGLQGGLVMLSFGLGTLPALLALGFMPNLLSRTRFRAWQLPVRTVSLCVAVLLLLRGMNLGIPVLSPLRAEVSVAESVRQSSADNSEKNLITKPGAPPLNHTTSPALSCCRPKHK
ncbi:MAG: sulfite exporter TauE/SafE family protein [Bacteroidota bacterium]